MLTTVSILGCGWLGYPLALSLLKEKGIAVKASTTSPGKLETFQQNSILPFLINTTQCKGLDDFLNCDILFISIPPKKDNPGYLPFLERISKHKKSSSIGQIIFISSTSVYPDIEKIFTEEENITEKNSSKELVYKAEQFFKDHLILRCAGLMGYDRIAGKYFANKTIDGCEAKVNYVHRDDVISFTKQLIKKEIKQGIYNLCSPQHPTKKEVYASNAKKHGFKEPHYQETITTKNKKDRLIDGSKVVRELGCDYIYQNPIDFI